ncbi:LacI family DNA-binding transcriptional regulator [uncultured Tateyamaria sp.]|uniref:LacI family DNA-binding transcriptional regulator n=1 Tax=uncultured Tateyamaria sp. TaxID=455651 RepID=UPI0026191408|nr:LacI family DNA-binding transcriptional regulator [uncultured Tateyamaria sp.]
MSDGKTIPTLDDVARAAGVSTATVSRCLNTPDRVVEKTRTKVLAVVEALGYTPNFGARAMAAKRTYTIGAIIPTMENAIFARGLQAFQEALHARGYTLLVSSTGYQAEVEAEQIRALVARGADGLLLIGRARDPSIYAFLRNRSVATLIAWTFEAGSQQPAVGFDNHAAMKALASAVIDQGHRRIGLISGTLDGNDRATARHAGIRDALTEHGLDPDDLPVIETSYEVENGGAAFETLMQRTPRPTAIMCGNDVLAVGAMKRARDMGLRVPEDVSITGFDDIELARIVTPELTTMRVPHQEMGRRAAEELVNLLEGTSPGAVIELDCALKLRGSLGPPPS